MVLHLYSMSGHSKSHTLGTAARLSATGLQAGRGKEDHLSTLLFANTLDGKHRCPTRHSEVTKPHSHLQTPKASLKGDRFSLGASKIQGTSGTRGWLQQVTLSPGSTADGSIWSWCQGSLGAEKGRGAARGGKGPWGSGPTILPAELVSHLGAPLSSSHQALELPL